MMIVAMGTSVDGFVHDRHGRFDWTAPDDELFAFHLERVRGLGAHLCGRRLYEAMVVWETDPALRDTDLHAQFADAWAAVPKIVFSRTLDTVAGNARLATRSLAEEAADIRASGRDAEVGGADLAGQAVEQGLVDELRLFRYPVIVGAGAPLLPPVTRDVRLDLVETRTFASRIAYERWAVTRG